MRAKIGKCFGALLCVLGIMLWLAAGLMLDVSAASANNSLTLICKTEEVTLVGMHWGLYRVGSRTGGGFVLEGDFADYPVSLADMSASAISAAADTLENYAVLDRIPPMAQGETGSDGLLKFDGLDSGLYMVCGKRLHVGDTIYVPSALLIEIEDATDGSHTNFDLNAYPKFYYRTLSSELSNFTVKKIWENDENAPQNRTVSISVEIYKDAEFWKTVVLDDSNDWSYSWAENSNADWRVKEKEVPDGYTVIYRSNETQFAIVNTYGGDITTTEPPTSPTESSSTSTEPVSSTSSVTSSTEAVSTASSSSTSSGTGEKLPQTGQLWWPVPIMACGGVMFIAVGCRLNLRNKKDDD